MKYSFIKQLACCGVVLVPAFMLTGCVDSSYGHLEDIDLTMGLGSDGLGVKLGNTDKILLKDILSVDENVKLDRNNVYYMVEKDFTEFEVNIDPLTIDIAIPTLKMTNVLDYDIVKEAMQSQPDAPALPEGADIPISAASGFVLSGEAESEDERATFTVDEISTDVKRINWISFADTELTLTLREEPSENAKLAVEKLRNAVITLPDMLVVSELSPADKWRFDEGTHRLIQTDEIDVRATGPVICKVMVNKADVNTDIDNTRTLEFNRDVAMTCDMDFYVTQDFNMSPDDTVTVKLNFDHVFAPGIDEVNGRFDPVIDPDITRVDVFGNLPDFLQDEDVVISVTNPTLKFVPTLEDNPIGYNFGASLVAVKEGEGDAGFSKSKSLTQVPIEANKESVIYYYDGDRPYDPEQPDIPETATTQEEDGLGDIIKKLPDYINVDLGNGNVRVQQDKDFTIRMGHSYIAKSIYDIYVPFEFDKELAIVYRDSTNSVGDDLKDYAAEGLQITAKAQNTIPLALDLTLSAIDAEGDVIPGIKFSTAKVKACTDKGDSPVDDVLTVDGTLDDPYDLRKIDRLVFRIKGDGEQNGEEIHQLISTQYLRLDDVRLRLKGQIIVDFN